MTLFLRGMLPLARQRRGEAVHAVAAYFVSVGGRYAPVEAFTPCQIAVWLPELQSTFVRDARRVLSGFKKPDAWRGDRVLILLLSFVLHNLVWLVWQQTSVPVTQPRLLNSVEVALVASSSPATPPAPPVSQPQSETPPVEPPKPKPKPKPSPKPMAKVEKRAEVRPEAFEPAAPSMPAAQAPPSVPFVEASYRADYLHNPPPKYPELAKQRHWEGLVVLRVQVLTDGSSGEVIIDRSSGYAALDEAAAEAAGRWSFVAAKRGDEAVASWVVIPVEFKLKNY